MHNHLEFNGHSSGRRLIESDLFPFEFISQLAEMESWRKEVYRPVYHIHKWWAKRLGSVFRGILLGSVLPDTENLVEAFYRQHNFAGLAVFESFYHHSRMDGWTALAEAVVGAGFALVNCHPVKSEMSVAAPKSQAKEPIQLDVVMVCRKQTADLREKTEAKIAFQRAVEGATLKARRLKDCDLTFSVNDRRVILISQFLVETCAGRSAEQLADVLSNSLTDLDLAAMRLLESQITQPSRQVKRDDRQLALLDKERTKRPTKDAQRIAKPVSYRRTRRRLP